MFGTFSLIAGLLVGMVPFYQEFSLLNTYTIKVDVVYAYFKTFDVSENVSALANSNLVSYVIVLNITNPTGETVRIQDLEIDFAQTASQNSSGVYAANTIIRYTQTFAEHKMEYYWPPNSSKLAAFTATAEISSMEFAALRKGKGYFLTKLAGRTPADAQASSGLTLKEATLEIINDNEFVYNITFPKNYRFHFRNDELGVSIEW